MFNRGSTILEIMVQTIIIAIKLNFCYRILRLCVSYLWFCVFLKDETKTLTATNIT